MIKLGYAALGQRVTERQFHDDLHQRLMQDPELVVGSPRGIAPRGSHGTERDRLRSFRSSHPLHRYVRIHAQCAKSSGSLAVSPRHQAWNRFHVRSRLYFLRAHRIK